LLSKRKAKSSGGVSRSLPGQKGQAASKLGWVSGGSGGGWGRWARAGEMMTHWPVRGFWRKSGTRTSGWDDKGPRGDRQSGGGWGGDGAGDGAVGVGAI